LWGQSTLRVSRPRAPGKIEYWSWWLTPVEAPDHIRALLRSKYNLISRVGQFYYREARLLDERCFQQWLALVDE